MQNRAGPGLMVYFTLFYFKNYLGHLFAVLVILVLFLTKISNIRLTRLIFIFKLILVEVTRILNY